MLLVPIGRDEAEIRRHAWVSYTIIAINILFFLATLFASHSIDEKQLQAKYEETLQYFGDHPWLSAPSELEPYLQGKLRDQLVMLREQARIAGALPPTWERERQQDRLQVLSSELASMARSSTPALRFGYVPSHPTFFTLLVSMFMHGGWMHLFGNLLFFFASGPFVEDVLGRPMFSVLYLTGGIAATWAHAWQNRSSLVPLVGASGAIAAIMGFYFVRFFRSRVEFFFLPFLFRPTLNFRFFLPAFIVLPLWWVWQCVEAAGSSGGAGVAFWAHIGGFLYGSAFAAVIRLTDFERKVVDPHVESQTSWKQDPAVVRAAEARRLGDAATARTLLQQARRNDSKNVDALSASYELACEMGDEATAGETATRLLEHYSRTDERELSIALLREIQATGLKMPQAYHLRAAALLERMDEKRWACDHYFTAISRDPLNATALRAMMQLARLQTQFGNMAEARSTLDQASRHPSCGVEWQEQISRQRALLQPASGRV